MTKSARSNLALGILIPLLCMLIGSALVGWRQIAVADSRITDLETHRDKSEHAISSMARKIDDIHWFLIEKNRKVK